MKNIYISFLLLGTVLLGACSDWLDVAPSNQVNDKDMFANGDGYRNALNGIYVKMAKTSLYGSNLSWGFLDVLGQTYVKKNFNSSSMFRKAADYKFDDSDVKSVVSTIWSTAYNDIADCNNLIEHVSVADEGTFQERQIEKNTIWGEGLALRALLHFDLLRMFAPMTDDGKKYIPYVDVYPTISTTYYTNTDILAKVEADLLSAKKLLATVDTTEQHKVWSTTDMRMLAKGTTNDMPDDVFFCYRGFRMNYYAVTALLARVYRWSGEYEKAHEQAQEIINASYGDANLFNFVSSEELSTNMKDYNSIILSLSNTNLTETYAQYITSGSNTMLYLNTETIFEGSQEDKRGTDLIGSNGSYKYSLKNTIVKGNVGSDMIPMIRLSEIYYIDAEYYARKNDWINAAKAIQAVRFARGIVQEQLTVNSMEDFRDKLIKEVRKELLGEGQLFFEYKYWNVKPATSAKFVFERPENEDV